MFRVIPVDEQTSGTPPATSATQTTDTEPAVAGMIFEYFYYFVQDHIYAYSKYTSTKYKKCVLRFGCILCVCHGLICTVFVLMLSCPKAQYLFCNYIFALIVGSGKSSASPHPTETQPADAGMIFE